MGEPVKIIDLATRMIELSGKEPGRDIAIEVVGIRPGEKLHEELFNVDEEVRPTRYGKIMRATRPPIDPAELRTGLDELGAARRRRPARAGLRDALVDPSTAGAPPGTANPSRHHRQWPTRSVLTVITAARSEILPAGASPVAAWGLLSRVARPMPGPPGRMPLRGPSRGRRLPGLLVRRRGAPLLHAGRRRRRRAQALEPSAGVRGIRRKLGGDCAWRPRARSRRAREVRRRSPSASRSAR